MEDERMEEQEEQVEQKPVPQNKTAARAGYATGRAIGGAVAAGTAAASWLGAKLMPQPTPGEKQETFDEYAFNSGSDAEISPEEHKDLFSTEGIEDNDSLPEIDGTSEDDDELQNVDETIYGDPNEEDPMSTEGIDEKVIGDTEEVITGEPKSFKHKVRVVYNYGPRRFARPSSMGYYQPPTIHEAGGR